uniref:Uncharacterized protein n=1 Tax=viral metagenome TaxID=1070528 RepID=A0A6C0AFX5_9ZZZZ
MDPNEYIISIVLTIITFLVFVALCIMSGFLSTANTTLKVDNNNQGEVDAKKYLDAMVSIGWIFAGLLILGAFAMCVLIYYGSISPLTAQSLIIVEYTLISIMILGFFVIGILAVIAAVYIQKGPNFSENQQNYNTCAWIGGLSVGLILVGIIFIVCVAVYNKTDKEKDIKNTNSPVDIKTSQVKIPI